ncbi:DUF3238 domain-containing protein [Cohnella sp. REN36]|uniref:DUF3238 domain-containing protein n=1 Tax=Cohnella sp. REN36 TaxID=2887347 RepID=UPI001D13E7E8|nr:DUF3238 domain-containing protein [Cohnella sp. REN36]MCC3374960.1 DUF3238 domain-containing protein [Cohnella sp. REN36]
MVQVQGEHDGFPNFEIFKKKDFGAWEPVYTFDAPANGKGILSLFPPMDVTGINHAI